MATVFLQRVAFFMFVMQTINAVLLNIPFDVSNYKNNSFGFTRSDDGDVSSASAYVRTDDETVYVAMAAQGSFVGFGASKDTHGTMGGADIVVCEGDPIEVIEYKGLGNYQPELDFKQDWTLIRSGRENGVTYCEISRDRVCFSARSLFTYVRLFYILHICR